jgi:CHAT domain-containing protein
VRREPSNARALNDLAVALSEYAQAHDDPSALIDSFVAADSAVRMDSTLAEARFTHAVLLEQLYLRTDAIAAWNRYLQIDGSSRWAAEARERVAALKPRDEQWKQEQDRLRRALVSADSQTLKSIIAAHPSDTREWIEKALGAWGAAMVSGNTDAARANLDSARMLARPLLAITGDAFVSDGIATIDRALAKQDSTLVIELAHGHAMLATGIERFVAAKFVEATADLSDARRLLSGAGSPMAAWASLFLARAQIRQSPDSAMVWLTAIRDSAPSHYFVLRSWAAQYQGFLYDARSDYVHMLAAYDSAVVENHTTREPQVTLRVASWLADGQSVLRGREAGWRTQYAALAASPRYPTVLPSLYSAFDYAALATAADAPHVSLRYCDESVRIARRMPDPTPLVYALRRRADLLARVGRVDLARADIDTAMATVKRIPNTASRAKLEADVMLAGAHIALTSAPSEAEAGLRRVVDEYKAVKYEKGLSSAYLYLAQSRAAAGMIQPARAAFDSATDVMQRQRATVADYAERGAFLDAARSVIDQILTFHAGNSGTDAFEFFEGNRSRVLLEQLAQGHSEAMSRGTVLAELQRRLTKDDVVLSYAVLPRELLVWSVGRDRFEQHRVKVSASELETLVNKFQQTLLDASSEPDSSVSERLYRILVDSASQLQRGANLIVIPDRWLHFVPFVALRDPATGRYLVRDHAVSYAPSATLLLSSLASPQQRFSHASKVLAVGNPTFDRQAFRLPDLPAADGEARRIASLYADQNPLIGKDATDEALERMTPAFDILHFAGHAVVGRNAPQLSHLVLASDGRSDGAVFSTEIAKWKLGHTRLVVLSGCNTADGKLSATEGASSLARAFFSAGVPAVVSSLWAIEDDDTADFFIAFHRRLVQGEPASVALRETQIKWLGDGRSPAHPVRSWAAFQLFGR